MKQTGQNSVRDIADTRLDREQRGRQAVACHFVAEELHQVPRDPAGRRVRNRKGQIAVGRLRLDDGDDLVGIAAEGRLADAIVGADERDRQPMGWSAVP
jgi:hypothetical protein